MTRTEPEGTAAVVGQVLLCYQQLLSLAIGERHDISYCSCPCCSLRDGLWIAIKTYAGNTCATREEPADAL